MIEPARDPMFLPMMRELFPEGSDRMHLLLARSMELASLPISDLYTLRDWLEGTPLEKWDSLALLLTALFLALEQGSLCVSLSPDRLEDRLLDLVEPGHVQPWSRQAVAELEAGDFDFLVGRRAEENKPILFWTNQDRRFLYFQKYLRAELTFQRLFRQQLRNQERPDSADRWRDIVREVLIEQPQRQAGKPLALDDDQKIALGLALLRPLVLISGGPGTGKTSIVLNLLRCLVRGGVAPERIALAAPTGRAAQRLSDSLRFGLEKIEPREGSPDRLLADFSASTLHLLLGYHPRLHRFRRHQENPIQADVVIVDEVSMVGVDLMSRLLLALRPGTRLILLGDKDQLPSVEAGAVLGQLVENLAEPSISPAVQRELALLGLASSAMRATQPNFLENALVLLRTNHRSQPAIREAAGALNLQDAGLLDRLPRLPAHEPVAWSHLEDAGGCYWWEQTAGSQQELRLMLDSWASHCYLSGPTSFRDLLLNFTLPDSREEIVEPSPPLQALFHHLNKARLLTLIREGPWGCDDINRHLDLWLRQRLGQLDRGRLFPGAPVLITHNDLARELFNGDVGLTLRTRAGGLRVVFARRDRFASYPADGLPAFELGFALTVHKSQGSEFDQVLVMLPPRGGRRLLSKELVYTGITRARKLALLAGTQDVLHYTIQHRIRRESGLTWE